MYSAMFIYYGRYGIQTSLLEIDNVMSTLLECKYVMVKKKKTKAINFLRK